MKYVKINNVLVPLLPNGEPMKLRLPIIHKYHIIG